MLQALQSSTMMKMVMCTLLLSLTSQLGCVQKPDEVDFKSAQKALHQGNLSLSQAYFKKVLEKSENQTLKMQSARELAEIYTQNSQYKDLNKVLHFMVANSAQSATRRAAKQQMADNSYFNLRNYSEAIRHYSHLMEVGHNLISNHLMVVKSYFNLNDLTQSEFEAQALLKRPGKIDSHTQFELKLVLANIAFSDKKFKNAAKAYFQVLKDFPEKARKNYVRLNLAMSYEEEGYYDKAVEVLRELRAHYHTPEFVDGKIKHLQSKFKHMPGGGRSGALSR